MEKKYYVLIEYTEINGNDKGYLKSINNKEFEITKYIEEAMGFIELTELETVVKHIKSAGLVNAMLTDKTLITKYIEHTTIEKPLNEIVTITKAE